MAVKPIRHSRMASSMIRKFRYLTQLIVFACFILFGALIAVKLGEDAGETLVGNFRVVDGDSLALADRRLRLMGIDAPERDQTCRRGDEPWACGRAATAALARFLEEHGTACRGDRKDRYKRLLVTCRAGTININARLVREGFAVAYGDYEDEEAKARAERAGIWASEFERPQDWRQIHGQAEEDLSSHRRSLIGSLFGY